MAKDDEKSLAQSVIDRFLDYHLDGQKDLKDVKDPINMDVGRNQFEARKKPEKEKTFDDMYREGQAKKIY